MFRIVVSLFMAVGIVGSIIWVFIPNSKDFYNFENVLSSTGSIDLLDPNVRIDTITIDGIIATVHATTRGGSFPVNVIRQGGYNYFRLNLNHLDLEGDLFFTTSADGSFRYMLGRKVHHGDELMIEGHPVTIYTEPVSARGDAIYAGDTGPINLKPLLGYDSSIMVRTHDKTGCMISPMPRK